MHPVALLPCCLVHAVRRYHMQGCHEIGMFWVRYAELVFHNRVVPLELGGPMESSWETITGNV